MVPAVESIHGINLYGIVLVGPGRLPKVHKSCVCMYMHVCVLLYEIHFVFF